MGKLDISYIEKLKYIYHLGLTNFFKPHMICFSKKSDLLSQWRGYANDGKGICIGFNREYFEKSTEYNDNKEFKVYEVIYSKREQEKMIRKFLRNFKIEHDIDELIKPDKSLGHNFFRIVKIANELFNLGICFKNPTFKEEEEIRIVHGYPEIAAEPDMFLYKFTEDNMISYIEIPINHKSLFPVIDEIIIGPKCLIERSDIKDFIEMNIQQIGINFHLSTCSLK